MKQNLDCAIVRDLLPLYQDEVVSETTKQAVEEHLAGCADCAAERERLKSWEPSEEQKTTAEGFASFRRKLRRKRILAALLAVVLTGAVLIGAGVVAHQVPLVSISEEDLAVHRVYRYTVDGDSFFFVLYERPAYSGDTHGVFHVIGDEKAEAEPLALQMKWKKTILARPLDWTTTDFWIFSAEGMNAQKEDATFAQLRNGEKVLWSEDVNGSDFVPEYVYVLHGFYKGQSDHPINAFFEQVDEGYLGVLYQDGRRVAWDLDGNVLSDGYADEEGNYPAFSVPN